MSRRTAGRDAARRGLRWGALPAIGLALLVPHHSTGQAAVRGCATLQPPPPQPAAGRVRLGIYPGGGAGAVGPVAAPRPMSAGAQLAALERLRGRRSRPFVLHLYTAYLGGWRSDDDALAAELDRFTRAGFEVEIVARYRPGEQAPHADASGFAAYIRRLVDRFGPDPRVVALQVTNEANVDGSADASDGAYPAARAALIAGVLAAHEQVARRGFRRLAVGFNWAPAGDAAMQRAFWRDVGRSGGGAFGAAVDWVGIDLYPGTFGSRRGAPGAAAIRGVMLRDLVALRSCLMPLARLGRRVPIHLSENGYPTGAGRPVSEQTRVVRTAVATARAYSRALGISDYRWFDLRDANSADHSFESHYGLLRDDFRPKPAFAVYRRLVAGAAR